MCKRADICWQLWPVSVDTSPRVRSQADWTRTINIYKSEIHSSNCAREKSSSWRSRKNENSNVKWKNSISQSTRNTPTSHKSRFFISTQQMSLSMKLILETRWWSVGKKLWGVNLGKVIKVYLLRNIPIVIYCARNSCSGKFSVIR